MDDYYKSRPKAAAILRCLKSNPPYHAIQHQQNIPAHHEAHNPRHHPPNPRPSLRRPLPPKRPCTPSEIALGTGIHLNINGQYAEYNATQAIESIEQQNPSGPTPAFYKAQGVLQGAVQEGMNLRLFNQQIAPPGNPAVPGLATYAAAEEVEKAQAAALTGVYAVDGAVLEALKGEILTGIKLNEGNLKAAVSECDFTLQFPPANEMGS